MNSQKISDSGATWLAFVYLTTHLPTEVGTQSSPVRVQDGAIVVESLLRAAPMMGASVCDNVDKFPTAVPPRRGPPASRLWRPS